MYKILRLIQIEGHCVLQLQCWPETWSRYPEGLLGHQQRQCRGVGGSDETKAYSWACLAWNQWKSGMGNVNKRLFLFVLFINSVFCIIWSTLTMSVSWGFWSHLGRWRGQEGEGCCCQHPKWWQRSPRLCRESLRSEVPTIQLQMTCNPQVKRVRSHYSNINRRLLKY